MPGYHTLKGKAFRLLGDHSGTRGRSFRRAYDALAEEFDLSSRLARLEASRVAVAWVNLEASTHALDRTSRTSGASRRENHSSSISRPPSKSSIPPTAGNPWRSASSVLWDLYKIGVSADEHLDGRAERIDPELPLYANREARLLCYWDHAPRMAWQSPSYYQAQRQSLRPTQYLRLHENRWTVAESTFITPELWDVCVDAERRPLLPSREHALFVGVDASTKHDSSAVVAVRWDGDRLALAHHRTWRPSPERPLDLEATLEAELRDLHGRYRVQAILCDPYQLHRSITTLKNAGLPIEEFPQTVPNTTRMGQALFDLLNGRNLRVYPAADLRAQALNTVAVESPRGFRIAKEQASSKIDAIVALAMASVAALDAGRPQPPQIYACGPPAVVASDGRPLGPAATRFLMGE